MQHKNYPTSQRQHANSSINQRPHAYYSASQIQHAYYSTNWSNMHVKTEFNPVYFLSDKHNIIPLFTDQNISTMR